MTPRDLAAAGFTEEPGPDIVLPRAETPPIFAFEAGEEVFARARVECDAGTMVQVLIECAGYRQTFWLPRSEVVKVIP